MNLCECLKNEMMNFADSLECILEEHTIDMEDLIYVRLFVQTLTPEQTMEHVVDKILPWKSQISKRCEDFFYKNKEIFGKLPEGKVNFFSDLVKNEFNEDDKNEIWDFFDVFITFAEEYKKQK